MDSDGTAEQPPVNVGKLQEFLVNGKGWLQTAAVNAVFKLTYDYGVGSLPVWNELFEVAVKDTSWYMRDRCQMLVYGYLQDNVGAGELFYRMRTEAEKPQTKDVNAFFLASSLIAIQNRQCGEEPFEVLAALVHKDTASPNNRDAVFLHLRRIFGAGPEFNEAWKKMRQAIVRRETKEEVSQLTNLRGLMKPQGTLQEKVRPKTPGVARAGNVGKVARV